MLMPNNGSLRVAFQVDQLCYVVWLGAEFWRATGTTAHFDAAFRYAMRNIVVQLR